MTDGKNIGLYIHVPFCRSKCPYCDFYSFRPGSETVDKYVAKVCRDVYSSGRTFDTVYFGGGTPSFLSPSQISEILGHISFTKDAEITVECNPSDAGGKHSEYGFGVLKSAGVNRISLGLQSAVDSERKTLGRRAGTEEVKRAIDRIRKAGIGNISLDIMLGIPGQTTETVRTSAEFCLSENIDHISAYMLQIEEGTHFHKCRDRYDFPDDETVSEMYLEICAVFENAGYEHYEISNFCKPGRESRHNLKYWHDEEYLGFGPAAHSFTGGKRFYYPENLESYLDGSSPLFEGPGGDEEEYIMLNLRLAEGLVFERFRERFGKETGERFIEKCRKFDSEKLGVLTAESFHMTDRGFLISNSVISELLEAYTL